MSDLMRSLNRLAKWRTFFAGWLLGTQDESHGPTRMIRNEVEARLVLRAEVTALTRILIEKGLVTEEHFGTRVAEEADLLSAALAERYPGITATDIGLAFSIPEAAETMRREGFPP